MVVITKTYLYNFDPLKPHFYIVKLGFTGVYIIVLIFTQKIDCGYSLEMLHRGGSNEYPQSIFWAEIRKKYQFFIWKFSSFWRWNFLHIWISVFSKWPIKAVLIWSLLDTFLFFFFVQFWSNFNQNAWFVKLLHLRHILHQYCFSQWEGR